MEFHPVFAPIYGGNLAGWIQSNYEVYPPQKRESRKNLSEFLFIQQDTVAATNSLDCCLRTQYHIAAFYSPK